MSFVVDQISTCVEYRAMHLTCYSSDNKYIYIIYITRSTYYLSIYPPVCIDNWQVNACKHTCNRNIDFLFSWSYGYDRARVVLFSTDRWSQQCACLPDNVCASVCVRTSDALHPARQSSHVSDYSYMHEMSLFVKKSAFFAATWSDDDDCCQHHHHCSYHLIINEKRKEISSFLFCYFFLLSSLSRWILSFFLFFI